MQTLQLEMVATDDPLVVLRKLVDAWPVRFYRMVGSERASHRIGFWKLIDQVLDGVPPSEVRFLESHGNRHC